MMRHKDGQTGNGSRRSRTERVSARCNGRRKWFSSTVIALAFATSVAGQSTEGYGQPGVSIAQASPSGSPVVLEAQGAEMKVTIRRDDVAAERLEVPLGTSAVVDVSLPVKRTLVSTPEVATVAPLSPRQVLVSGEGVGITQVILWGEKEEDRLVFAVTVVPNLAQLKAVIQNVVPDAEIELRSVNDGVVVSGSVRSADEAEQVMALTQLVSPKAYNHITIAGEQQVLLRCTVAEVSKSAVRSLQVDGWASFEDNAPRVNALDITNIDTSLIGPVAGAPGAGGTAAYGNTFLFGSDSGGFQFATSSKSLQMEMFVRAMQENGLLRVLAEPNLVALSGQPAEFLAGGEFPVPVPQGTGAGTTITVEWKNYGVSLQFVPTVIGQQMIRLTVAPEVSQIDYTNSVQQEGFVIPGVTQRRASTTVELAGGTTIAIAGLLSEELRGALQKIPGLGDVPILGSLFRSVEYQRDLTELVILVTPELVSSMYPDQVGPLPGDDLAIPNDWELYGLGMLEGRSKRDTAGDPSPLLKEFEPNYRKFRSPPEQMSLHGPWGAADAAEVATIAE